MRSVLVVCLMFTAATFVRGEFPSVSPIRLNTVGFLPSEAKVATIATHGPGSFSVLDEASGKTVLSAQLIGPKRDLDTSETVWFADFSAVAAPGKYRLKVADMDGGVTFTIAPAVFSDAFRTVTRGMYLWRCGTAVRGEHNGDVFEQKPCHMEDGWMDHATGEHVHRDGTGGWHDAGDHNKYIANAAVTVGCMLRAWEEFGPAIQRVALDIPESGGPIPDLLAEVKWEMDWFFKMQADDGRVFHKLSTLNFGAMIMPDVEDTPRFFTGWSTVSTADFVAAMAQMARLVQPYDAHYAAKCLAAARKSYQVLRDHPAEHAAEQSKFSTGRYHSPDPDDRLWAAAELWETTGDADVLVDLEARIRTLGTRFDQDFGWGAVKNLGLISYLRSQRPGRDETLVKDLLRELVAVADQAVGRSQRGGYGRPLGSIYYWGCNGGVAMQAMVLQNAYALTGHAEYRTTALQAVDHLLGRNFFGRSMVTGVGGNPPLQPHCRRSAGDEIAAPWPGYLVGGPQKGARDWDDLVERFQVNEIAINWNGAMIYALAGFLPSP